MIIYVQGILFDLKDSAYSDFLVHIIEGTMPEGWLLKNSKNVNQVDIDLNNFTPEQAKEELRKLLFSFTPEQAKRELRKLLFRNPI